MKLIVAGSRHFDEEEVYAHLVDLRITGHPMGMATEIVSGEASGVDSAGEWYAEFYDIPVKLFPAEWDKYGKLAGPRRNGEMAAYADALLLIWDGESKGSLNMKQRMQGLRKPVYELVIKGAPQ